MPAYRGERYPAVLLGGGPPDSTGYAFAVIARVERPGHSPHTKSMCFSTTELSCWPRISARIRKASQPLSYTTNVSNHLSLFSPKTPIPGLRSTRTVPSVFLTVTWILRPDAYLLRSPAISTLIRTSSEGLPAQPAPVGVLKSSPTSGFAMSADSESLWLK